MRNNNLLLGIGKYQNGDGAIDINNHSFEEYKNVKGSCSLFHIPQIDDSPRRDRGIGFTSFLGETPREKREAFLQEINTPKEGDRRLFRATATRKSGGEYLEETTTTTMESGGGTKRPNNGKTI